MTDEERQKFTKEVAIAIQSHMNVLSTDEIHWIKLAIKKEAQSINLRQAIIEKTLAGLAWAAVVGAFYLLVEWAKSHGYKS